MGLYTTTAGRSCVVCGHVERIGKRQREATALAETQSFGLLVRLGEQLKELPPLTHEQEEACWQAITSALALPAESASLEIAKDCECGWSGMNLGAHRAKSAIHKAVMA